MKYVIGWSGGKDSTATVLLAHEQGLPVDVIVMSEVLYDKEKSISGENPLHMRFVKEECIPLFESWGYKVVIVHADKDFKDCFFHKIEKARKYKEHNGMIHGFPLSKGMCNIKRDCKLDPIAKYIKSMGWKRKEVMEYVGFAIDEKERIESLKGKPNTVSILEQYGYTEKMAAELCERYGLLSPIYSLNGGKQARQGCWFCPNSKLCEVSATKALMPDAWKEYVSLEDIPNIAYNKWNVYTKQTLKERDKEIDELAHACTQTTCYDMFTYDSQRMSTDSIVLVEKNLSFVKVLIFYEDGANDNEHTVYQDAYSDCTWRFAVNLARHISITHYAHTKVMR